MPTYVYTCKNCGHQLEQHQSFHDDALVTCPTCDQDALRKVYNSVGIVFKGSGFYSTDSGSKASATTGTQATSTDSAADSSSPAPASSTPSAVAGTAAVSSD